MVTRGQRRLGRTIRTLENSVEFSTKESKARELEREYKEKIERNFEDSPIIGSEIIENKYSWAILREKIINFFNQAKPSQTLLFYYSGHGIHGKGDIFLATPQVEPKNPSSRGFSFSELEKSMGTSKSRKIVGIIGRIRIIKIIGRND